MIICYEDEPKERKKQFYNYIRYMYVRVQRDKTGRELVQLFVQTTF